MQSTECLGLRRCGIIPSSPSFMIRSAFQHHRTEGLDPNQGPINTPKLKIMGSPPIFQPSCPDDESFYACGWGTGFLGCCANTSAEDACQSGCPQADLRPASFDQQHYDSITKNITCPYGSLCYTCRETQQPFMGCCKANACSVWSACPLDDLMPAFLPMDEAPTSAFSSILIDDPSLPPHHPPPSHLNLAGPIAGSVLGGLVVVIIILTWTFLIHRKRKLQSNRNNSAGSNEKNALQGS